MQNWRLSKPVCDISGEHWSLSNLVQPISDEQCVQLIEQFYDAAQAAFGACTMELVCKQGPERIYPNVLENNAEQTHFLFNQFQVLENVSEIKRKWHEIGYLEITFRPTTKPSMVEAIIEFGGFYARQVSFHVRPTQTNIKEIMCKKNRWMCVGDGQRMHGDITGKLPFQDVLIFS